MGSVMFVGCYILVLLQASLASVEALEDCPNLDVTSVWNGGLSSILSFTIDHQTHGWEINLKYDRQIGGIYVSQGVVESQDNQHFRITSLGWNGELVPGQKINLSLQPYFSSRPFLVEAFIDDQDICGFPSISSTTTSTTTTTTTKVPTTTTPTWGQCSQVVEVLGEGVNESALRLRLTPTLQVNSWTVNIDFEHRIWGILSSRAEVGGGGESWVLFNKPGDGSIPGGSTLVLNFSVQHPGTNLPAVRALRFNGVA